MNQYHTYRQPAPIRCAVCGSMAMKYLNNKVPVCGTQKCHETVFTRYNLEPTEQE